MTLIPETYGERASLLAAFAPDYCGHGTPCGTEKVLLQFHSGKSYGASEWPRQDGGIVTLRRDPDADKVEPEPGA